MLPEKNEKEITKRALKLCEHVWSGAEPAHLITYYLEYLCLHLPDNRLEPALEWLLKRGIQGKLFADFAETTCQASGLELIRHITKGIEHDRHLRVIRAEDIA